MAARSWSASAVSAVGVRNSRKPSLNMTQRLPVPAGTSGPPGVRRCECGENGVSVKPSDSSARLAASTSGTKCAMWSRSSMAASVAQRWVDGVQERLSGQEALEIAEPPIEKLRDVARVVARHVRHDDEVRHAPHG